MRKPFIYLLIVAVTHAFSTVLHAQEAPQNPANTLVEQQFFTAVRQNNAKAVQDRLRSSSQVNTLDTQFPHNSALHWAAWENASDVLGVLLKQKDINVDILNAVNETPLMIASLKGNVPVTTQLLVTGAYPNKEGWAPLHYAATQGHVEVIKILLDAHAYIDAESPNKTTPLMMAARSKNILAVKILLDEGADATLKNNEGWTAHTFAEKAGATDIAEGLQLRLEKLKARESQPAKMR